MCNLAPPTRVWRSLLLLLALSALARSAQADGEAEPVPLSDSLAGTLFDAAATPEGETQPPIPASPVNEAVSRYLQENPVPFWARPQLETWANAHAGAISAAQGAPNAQLTIGELADQVRDAAGALEGPQLGGAGAVLDGAAPDRSAKAKFLVRKPKKDTFIRRSTSPDGPVGVFAASGPTPDYEYFLPVRLRTLGPTGYEFTCGEMAAQGYLRFRAYLGQPIVIEYDLHLEHAFPNLHAVIVRAANETDLIVLPAGAGAFDYTFTGTEADLIQEGAWIFMIEDGTPVDEHILALGPVYDIGMAVECEALLSSGGQDPVSKPLAFLFDPKSVDLLIMGNDLEVESESPSSFHLHGHDGGVNYGVDDPGTDWFFRYLDKADIAPLWGPTGFEYADLHYDDVNGNPLTLTGVPDCPAPTGDIVECGFTLTGDGAGTAAAGEIEGGLLLLFHPLGVSVSLHMDLSGITGAQSVRMRDPEDQISFEAPVLGPNFDYIFNPCEIDFNAFAAATVEVTTTQYPDGAYAGAPSCQQEASTAQYRPGCETAITLRIENPSNRPVKALGATVQLPYGWALVQTTAANGTTGAPQALPAVVPSVNAQGRLEYAWLNAPAFPYDLRLRLQPTGAPGSGTLGARYLTFYYEYRESGRARLSPAHTVRFFADYPQPEGATEGEGEGEGEYPCEDFDETNNYNRNLDDSQFAPVFVGSNNGGQGEGEGQSPLPGFHSADTDQDHDINISEIMRIIQFYNSGGFHCQVGTEDGYAPGYDYTKQNCDKHTADYAPQNFQISISEVLRLVQIYNSDGYYPTEIGEDGFGLKVSSIRLGETEQIFSCDETAIELSFTPVSL